MAQVMLDPIYGSIELDTSSEDLFKTPELAAERRRLERLKNLGLINMSFASANHSKWEHHLGMYHLAKQVRLPKEERKKLELLCLLGGIGHLPFTFPTEEAVLLASRLNRTVKQFLEDVIQEVLETCGAIASQEFRDRVPKSPSDMRTEELHAWFTAYKFKRLPRQVNIGDRSHLIYERVNLQGSLNELYRFLSRVDFVQRDLYYTGLAKFSLSADGFLRRYATVQELSAAPEALLLDQLRSYLADSLYFEVRSVSREAVYKKRLALMLSQGRFEVRELLRWSDSEMESGIELQGGRPWWDELTQVDFTRICSAKIPNRGRRLGILDLESQILGRTFNVSKLLNYPETKKFVVVVKPSSDSRDGRANFEAFISSVGKPKNLAPIAQAVYNLSDMVRATRASTAISKSASITDLLAYVLNATVRFDYRFIVEILASGFSRMVRKRQRRFARLFNRTAGAYTFFASGFGTADFWEENVRSPQFRSFIDTYSKELGELIRLSTPTGERGFTKVIEAVIWLNEHSELKDLPIKWIVPNVTLEGSNGLNQVDAISLFIKGNKTVLRLHECSKSGSEGKAFDDLQKLEKIRMASKQFDDLQIEKLVYGASGVREHFYDLRPLLDRFRVREKKKSS
jgi:hypothetical protein